MMPMARAKFILGGIWFGSFFVLTVVLIFIATTFQLFSVIQKDVFAWYMPLIVPILSLMVSTYAYDATTGTATVGDVNSFYFMLTTIMSVLYLISIVLVIAMIPLTPDEVNPEKVKEIMSSSNLYLSPLQALSTALLVIFFRQKKMVDVT